MKQTSQPPSPPFIFCRCEKHFCDGLAAADLSWLRGDSVFRCEMNHVHGLDGLAPAAVRVRLTHSRLFVFTGNAKKRENAQFGMHARMQLHVHAAAYLPHGWC